jgi:hypothetical protein
LTLPTEASSSVAPVTLRRLLPLVVLVSLVVAPAAAGAKTVTRMCRGASSCTAGFSLRGGASNVKLVIELPGTSYRRPRVSVTPSSLRGSYDLSGGKFQLGGSEYTVTLNAVQSIRRGTLTFVFRPTA